MAPEGEKKMRTNLPKRDELLLRIVWAFPNASKIGLACRICRSRRPNSPCPEVNAARSISDASFPLKLDDRGSPEVGADVEDGIEAVAIAARYWMTFLVFSVLPAPDSPLDISLEILSYSRNEDTLVLPFFSDLLPRTLCDCEDVRRVLLSPLRPVLCNDLGRVDRQWSIRVEGDEK